MMGLGRLPAALKRAAISGRVVLIVFLLAAHGLIVPALHLLIPDARADTVTYAYDALGRYGLAIAAVAAVGWRRKYG